MILTLMWACSSSVTGVAEAQTDATTPTELTQAQTILKEEGWSEAEYLEQLYAMADDAGKRNTKAP